MTAGSEVFRRQPLAWPSSNPAFRDNILPSWLWALEDYWEHWGPSFLRVISQMSQTLLKLVNHLIILCALPSVFQQHWNCSVSEGGVQVCLPYRLFPHLIQPNSRDTHLFCDCKMSFLPLCLSKMYCLYDFTQQSLILSLSPCVCFHHHWERSDTMGLQRGFQLMFGWSHCFCAFW